MSYGFTLLKLLESELSNNNISDYLNNNRLIMFDKDERHLSKIVKYDDDVKKVARNTIFYNLPMVDPVREKFENEFILKFINRTFLYQSYEIVAAKLNYYISVNREVFINLYEAEKYINAQNENTSIGTNSMESRNNSLTADLPQTQVNIALDVDGMAYANDVAISKSLNKASNNTTNLNKSYQLQNLSDFMSLKEILWDNIDLLCFSQIG